MKNANDKKKNPWKKFVIAVSVLLSVMIVCAFTNVTINSFINSIQKNPAQIINGANTNTNGGANSFTPDYNGGVSTDTMQNGGMSSDPSGLAGSAGTAGSTGTVGGNTAGGTQTPAQNTNSPLNYNTAQLVDFYNAALKKSYNYKLNATKVENVTVAVSGVDIGNLNLDVDDLTNNIVKNNTKNNGVNQTKTFVNGKSTDGSTTIQQFVLPTNLYADAVKNITIQDAGNGAYVMKITLKEESCAHNGTAKYNASCTWPLDVSVIDFGQAVTIKSCTFNYPGTVITAKIDSQGRVTDVMTEMPLNVANAQATAVGINITVGSIQGKWVCTNKLTFAG